MSANKILSIVVPVYKVESYLNQCLQSIVSQTYSDLQVILVDDGSPDGCPELCDVWSAKDKRIQVIHQKNQGVSAARNTALKLIMGEYVLFVDSDDWVEPQMAETMIRAMESDEDIDAVFCGYSAVNDLGNEIEDLFDPPSRGAVARNDGVAELFGMYGPALWNKMFKRTLLGKENIFDTTIKIGEDELWAVQTLKNARKIALIGDPLYVYRNRKDSASKDFSLSPARLTEIESQKAVLQEIEAYHSEELTLLAQKRLYYSGQHIMKLAFYAGDYKLFTRIDKEIDEARKIWFAHHTNFLGSCRRKMVELMMRRKFPLEFVRIFDK